MKLPSESQWAQYSALCARLRPLPTAERAAALQGLQAQGTHDPQVLSLVAVHFTLPPDPDGFHPGERVGSCTLEEPLGAGGMGVVYRAQQHLGPARRPVAVKLIHPALLRTARAEACTQFLTELQILVTLHHDGIARIYDGGLYADPHTQAQLPYLVMELVHGALPLTTYARDLALPWRERLALLVRVCRAVEYAHAHRVVHRDLKPANILVDPEGRPLVIDFGLACTADALLPGAQLVAGGTPAYMSPEQVSDTFGPISAKSDVYALGLLLYELLTGQLPYGLPRATSIAQWGQVITAATPLPPSQYDPVYRADLDAIVAAALAKRPTERCSVAVLRARLERALQPPPDNDRLQRPTAPPDWAQARPASPPSLIQPEPVTALRRAAGPSGGPRVASAEMPDAERRQLTILLCDFVDATQRAGPRDPEDWREVVHAYQQTCTEVIHHYDGYVAQRLGEGLLIYFGWPQAHEDAALRAVRTGLGLLEATGRLQTHLVQAHGFRLALRVGIHTGLVVVGEMGDGQQAWHALGDTPHLASRLQDLATPDTVVISAATFRLVEGYFTVEDLGHQELKGVAAPLQVYQVVGATAAQSRLESTTTALTPLIGRDTDVALLYDRWAQSRDGQGQVVLLSGEAGIGKSRLVEELTAHVRGEGARRMMFRCSPYHTHSAFFPVIAYLQRRLHWHPDEAPAARVTALEQALQPYGFALQDVVPLFATLLSLPLPEHYPPLTLSPQRQKQQTQEALVAWLLAEAERQPVLVVWEDLHWADPSSLDLLSMLIDQTPTAPLLLLLACRPEFAPPWRARAPGTQLTLPRLTHPQIAAMVQYIAGGTCVPAAVVHQISVQTDGVPLFVEELTKTILESGLLKATTERYAFAGPLPAFAIPTSLQDALMARLDRLGSAKGLAQLGAMLGRQFAYALLREVAQRDEASLQSELGQLVEAAMLYQRGQPPHATYRFKHTLIQEAAYQSLLRRTRQQYHQRIAQVLEAQFPDTAETQPEVLAHHYTEAGCKEQAVGYWQRAGQQALQRSAHLEAVRHLTAALVLLGPLPDTAARAQQELDLQIALGAALIVTKGPAAPEVEQTFARARALCQAVGASLQLFPTLRGLWQFYLTLGALLTARELGEQLYELAQRVTTPTHRLIAHEALGVTLFYLGDYAAARLHLEHGIALSEPAAQRPLALRQGVAPGVRCLSLSAHTLWCLGFPAQAIRRSQEALAVAQALAHPYSLAHAQVSAGWLHQRRREAPAVQALADTQLTLATAQEFLSVGLGSIGRGWALAMQGQGETGLAHLRQGLTAVVATGQTLAQPYCLLSLAEAAGHTGHTAEGLRLLDEALTVLETTTQGDGLAEAYQLRGVLLLCQAVPDAAHAEACFQQALAIAARQHAKSLELRAAMSLSRLWQQQGKQAEGRELLAPIYGWFTEGFDTADLQEAKALLEALGG